jgi:hypothetical protein
MQILDHRSHYYIRNQHVYNQEIWQYGKNTHKYVINENYKKKSSKKILLLKMKKRWHGHVKEVLEKNVLYKVVSAKIKKTKYSFVTLISVKPVPEFFIQILSLLVMTISVNMFFISVDRKGF